MRAIRNAVRLLQLADIPDDRVDVGFGHLRLRRHVAERPVVGADAVSGGQHEGVVGMMPWIVHVVDERGP